MTDFLLKLFSIRAADATNISDARVMFHGINPLYIFLAAIVLGAAVVWMYRRTPDIRPWRKYTLAALRALFLVLVLGLLLRPVLTITLQSSVRRTVLMLFDTSASMSQILDRRTEDEDIKRIAMARNVLDPTKGLEQPLPSTTSELTQIPRLDVVKAACKNPTLNLLPALAQQYDIAAFTFDRKLTEIPAAAYRLSRTGEGEAPAEPNAIKLNLDWLDQLEAKGSASAIGDAVRDVISRKRGQPLAGIVLVTDGASNAGVQPLDAASAAGQDGVPLYVYGVGITSPRDIIVSTIFAQEVAFAKDDVPVTVRVRSAGLSGQTAKLVVKLGDERAEQDLTFNADGEQLVTVKLTPKVPGDYQIDASIQPRDDEVVKDNNASAQRIRVIDGKIKILYVEQYPRWEFKYAQAILLRDRRVDLKCVLLEGHPDIASQPGSPYLRQFPQKKEDLFKYDVVILGDIGPQSFTQMQLDAVHEFVSKFGGAVIMVAGKRNNPNTFRRSHLERMLPVELESLLDGVNTTASRPVKLELTPGGKSNFMLRLAEKELESVSLWTRLPPVYWVCKVARAKPGADVLVVDSDPTKASRYGKMPVIASHQYGMGQILYIGTDNLWRWRKNVSDKYHSMLWGQMVQRMALPHMLGASKRTQLTSDQRSYSVGDKVTVFARLYTESFEPMKDPAVKALYTEAGSTALPAEVILRAIPDRPGMFRGELVASAAGNFQLYVEHDRNSKLEFAVTDPKHEITETAMNKGLLEQLADRSGGAFFREEDLHKLPEKLGSKNERLESTLHVELWSSPFYFILMMLVLTSEWVLRKMSQLK